MYMEFSKYFDHTNLKADATSKDIDKLCEEAKKYNFMSVCINPFYIDKAKELLLGTDVKICTVIGFPLGQMTTEMKVAEATNAVMHGAEEVDMVINVAKAKENDFAYVENEIRHIKQAIGDVLLKVILENCYLSKDQILNASLAAKRANADFVKTSTGFGKGGATVEDVRIMREAVGQEMGVKAAGGIHSLEEAESMIKAGANRIGCSASVSIMEERK